MKGTTIRHRTVAMAITFACWAILGASTAAAQSGTRGLADRLREQERSQERARFERSAAASASGPITVEALELPTDPRLWRNSAPLSLEALEGKGVVFYFFEEQCPICAEKWPALHAMAQKHRSEPVLFVAVNSGTDPRTLGRYLSQYRVQWPVIVDVNRSLESDLGVPTISLDGSVFAVRYRNGDGEFAGAGADFEKTVKAALKGAEWRVEPSAVPRELRTAWQAIEFGDFPAAARAVNKAVNGKDGPVKDGARRLLDAVEAEARDLGKVAQKALNSSDNWTAYKALDEIDANFGEYESLDLIGLAQTKRDELAKLDSIGAQVEAAKLLEKAITVGSKGGKSAIRRGRGLLEQVVSRHPGTEAADKAQALLAQFGS